jgi:hypothetical protein
VNDAPDGQVDLPDDYFIQMSESAARILSWQPLPELAPLAARILCWQPLPELGSPAAAEFSQPSPGLPWRQQVVSPRDLIAPYAEPWIVAA